MQILLGNRDLGQIEITAIAADWEKYPEMQCGKLRSMDTMYLILDTENLKELVSFYDVVVQGDQAEGKVSEKPYYTIKGIQYGNLQGMADIRDAKKLGWDLYKMRDEFAGATYFVEIY